MEQKINSKELLALLMAGLLSPLLRVLPEETAGLAGAGGWVAPLLALPLFLLPLTIVGKTIRRLPGGGGIPQLYACAFGRPVGRLLTLLTGLWIFFTALTNLRYYAESFLSSIYPDTDLWIFVIGLSAVAWMASRKGIGALCRVGQILFRTLALSAGAVALLGLREVRLYHIWPVWMEGWGELAASAIPVLSILSNSLILLYVRGDLAREEGGLGRACRWYGALALALSLLALVVIGMFGHKTALRLQMPFFSAAKEVTVLGVFERVEAVVAAAWVLSDLVLQCLFLWAGTELLAGPGEKGRGKEILRSLWALGGAVGSVVFLPDIFLLDRLWQREFRWVDGGIDLLLPLLACIPVLWKTRGKAQDMVDGAGK